VKALPSDDNLVSIHGMVERPPAGMLPWEDAQAFVSVRSSFIAAYSPTGPAETSLVDCMVWVEWRRERLRAAEAAVHVAHAFDRASEDHAKRKTLLRAGMTDWKVRDEVSIAEILRGNDEEDAETLVAIKEGLQQTERALERLAAGDGYATALGELDDTLAEWWTDALEETHDNESKKYAESAEALQRFLEGDALPWRRRWLIANEARPAIRAQAIAESFDPLRIRQLWEMEARLDRQFEKALSMLIRLQEMRVQMPSA
jgi:hypothetical protein